MQNGLLLCDKDIDDPIMWYRDKIRTERIAEPTVELENVTATIRGDPNDYYDES